MRKCWNHILIVLLHLLASTVCQSQNFNGIFSQLIAFTCQLQVESLNHMVSHVKTLIILTNEIYNYIINDRGKTRTHTHTQIIYIVPYSCFLVSCEHFWQFLRQQITEDDRHDDIVPKEGRIGNSSFHACIICIHRARV